MNLAEEAFAKLYPEKKNSYAMKVKYSAKFKAYNGNVRRYGSLVTFGLSRKLREVSKDIQIGLIQELMLKLFKEPRQTMETGLYNAFIQNVHMSIPKHLNDEVLEKSFNHLNETFFLGMLERPNFVWGSRTFRKLGCYEYGTDTITISSVFKNADTRLLDYVMYHEMLHKKLKFSSKNGRSHHHTLHFRQMENAFPNSKELEAEISRLVRAMIN